MSRESKENLNFVSKKYDEIFQQENDFAVLKAETKKMQSEFSVLEEQLKNEEFKKEWEDLQPEYSIIDSLIKARLEQGITQKQLSEMTGIQQSNISRLESGNYNPTINFLKRIAKALGKELYVEFK